MKKAIVMIAVAAIVSVAFFYTPKVEAATLVSQSTYTNTITIAPDLYCGVSATVFKPYMLDRYYDSEQQYYYNSQGQMVTNVIHDYSQYYVVTVQYTLRFANFNNSIVRANRILINFRPEYVADIPFNCYSIEDIPEDFVFYQLGHSDGYLSFRPVNNDLIYNSAVAFPAMGAATIQFKVNYYYLRTESVIGPNNTTSNGVEMNTNASYIRVTGGSFENDTYTVISGVTAQRSNIFNMQKIFGYFEQLIGGSENTSGVNNQSDSLNQQTQQVHIQEQSYYQQNQQAIHSTGLSNYQFSNDQIVGTSAVSNDFTSLWNALGSWTGVYIFSLTLSLALTILRHMPHGIRKKKESTSGGSS